MAPNLVAKWSAGEDDATGCNIEGNMEEGGGSGQTVLVSLAPSPILGGAFSSLQNRLELVPACAWGTFSSFFVLGLSWKIVKP